MAITYQTGWIKVTATGNTALGKYRVTGLNWSGGANTNTLVVDDENDVEIFNFVANTGQLETGMVIFPRPIPVGQIKVTMTAGTLLVYIE